jgi:hypothetical protein
MNRSKFSRRGRRWKTKRQRAWRRGLLRMCRAFFDADQNSFEHLCSLWPSNSYGTPMPEITIEQALAAAEKLREITERELARIPGFVRGSVDVKRSGPRAFSVQSKWCNPGMPEAVTWPVHGPEDFEIKKLVGVPPGVSVVTLREPYPVVHELVMVPPKHAGTQTIVLDAEEFARVVEGPAAPPTPAMQALFFTKVTESASDPEQRCACGESTPEGEHERSAYCTSEWERAEAERITIEGAQPCERCDEINKLDDGEPCGCECPSCGARGGHADGCPDTVQCECCAAPPEPEA